MNINSETSKQVASYWQDLLDKGLVSTVADFSNDWNAALNNGTIASWPSAVWGQGVVKGSAKDTSGQWGVAPMPQWTAGGATSAMWGGSAVSVITGTKHPKEADEFARWYLTNSGSLEIGVKEIGWFPSNKVAQASSDVNSPDPFFSNQVVDTTFEQAQIPTTWTWPPNLTTVNQLQGDDMNTAVTNKTSIVAVLDQLQTQVVNDLKSNGINVVAGS